MKNLLLKQTVNGERAYPIDAEELKKMEAAGTAVRVCRNPSVYRVAAVMPDQIAVDEPEVQQTYRTRNMVAKRIGRSAR